jgi:hypothetical protein
MKAGSGGKSPRIHNIDTGKKLASPLYRRGKAFLLGEHQTRNGRNSDDEIPAPAGIYFRSSILSPVTY